MLPSLAEMLECANHPLSFPNSRYRPNSSSYEALARSSSPPAVGSERLRPRLT